MEKKKFKLKNDKYRKTRGGYSRFLLIRCSKCETPFALYQKDGPGPLKRMYLDRILAPEALAGLEKLHIKDVKHMICPKCKQSIGTPYIYDKENRLAFLLNPTSFTKKITKGSFPSEDK